LKKGWEEVLIGKEKPDKYYKIGKKDWQDIDDNMD
jgi:hypothetical protein